MTADIVQRHQPRSPACVQLFIRGELLPNSCHRTIGFPYIEPARPSGQSKKAVGQMRNQDAELRFFYSDAAAVVVGGRTLDWIYARARTMLSP